MDSKEAVEFLIDEKYVGEGIIELPLYQKEQNKRLDDVIELIDRQDNYIDKLSKYKKYWDDERDTFIH